MVYETRSTRHVNNLTDVCYFRFLAIQNDKDPCYLFMKVVKVERYSTKILRARDNNQNIVDLRKN